MVRITLTAIIQNTSSKVAFLTEKMMFHINIARLNLAILI